MLPNNVFACMVLTRAPTATFHVFVLVPLNLCHVQVLHRLCERLLAVGCQAVRDDDDGTGKDVLLMDETSMDSFNDVQALYVFLFFDIFD
jgi:hypothetical protein